MAVPFPRPGAAPSRPARAHVVAALACLAAGACTFERSSDARPADSAAAGAARDSAGGAADEVGFALDSAYGRQVQLTSELLGDTAWRAAANRDRQARHPDAGAPVADSGTGAVPATMTADTSALAQLAAPQVLAARGPVTTGAGPSVLRAQILLDQAGFSPGAMDGRWGGNSAKAAYWFQDAQGLPTTGLVDQATMQRLERLVGRRAALVRYTVAAEDVAGPFQAIPDSPYAQAKLPCLCYGSAMELLAERHHTTGETLVRLNPGLDTTRMAAGATLWVPNVRRPTVAQRSDTGALARRFPEEPTAVAAMAPAGTGAAARPTSGPAATEATPDGTSADSIAPALDARFARADSARGLGEPRVARIVVSRQGSYLHALDASGRILLHAPSTLGSGYDPSPTGGFRIVRVAYDPTFHYNPKLYAEVPDTRPDAQLPAGPNAPVGVVWMALDKPHYGIHGTSAPETVGYAVSHGCVRLTNWDVRWLADHTPAGTPVEFR